MSHNASQSCRLPLGLDFFQEQGVWFQYLSQEPCALSQLQAALGSKLCFGTGVMVLEPESRVTGLYTDCRL